MNKSVQKKMHFEIRKKVASIFVGKIPFAIFLFIAVIFGTIGTIGIFPEKVSAQFVPVLDSPNLVENTTTAGATFSLANKEVVLDGILTSAMKVVLSNITSSIVTWINSGFQGSPAFVTNPESFLTDVADQIAGNFIAGTELGFMCEPFSLDIRLALNLGYSSTFTDRNYCRLSDVVSNTENFTKFTDGDFSQGGWNSWFEISQNPSNNPMGAYIEAQNELSIRTARGQSIELAKLDWGAGFLSYRSCLQEDSTTGDCIAYGEIETPGSVIEDQLNQTLNTGQRQLEIADEINEVVGALVGQLAETVLTEGLASFGVGGSNQNSLLSGNTSTPLSVWCSPNASTSQVGQNVRWSAVVFGGIPGATSYVWTGDGVEGATTASVDAFYATTGVKSASVRVTKGGQNIFQRCNNSVNVI